MAKIFGEMRVEAETHVGLIFLPVPFDDALAACIGAVRALHGPVGVNEGDLRRPQVIGAENRARVLAHNLPLAFDLPGTLVIEAGPRLTVIDDFLQSGLSHVLSALFPEALVLTLKHMQEGKTRTERSLMIRQGHDLVRFAGVYRNVTKTGWDWDEEGEVTQWECDMPYGARAMGARITPEALWDLAGKFGVEVSTLWDPGLHRTGTIEKLSHSWIPVLGEVSEMHMDISRRCLELGFGDALNLEPVEPSAGMKSAD
ncbi:MAG: hypothetical protein AAGA78_13860 [Pseudomonadota bacterium]